MVCNNSPEQFEKLGPFFDVVVVDAPCSGSGLFRKQKEAIMEWSLEHVEACSIRQKNILQSALLCLKEDGVLFYSTCSYSKAENEDVVDWLIKTHDMERLPLSVDPNWGIVEGKHGLRLYPHLSKSEGFFCSLLRKKNNSEAIRLKGNPLPQLSEKDKKALQDFVFFEDIKTIKRNEKIYQMNDLTLEFLRIAPKGFYFKKAGQCLGELKHDELVPDQELALSSHLPLQIRNVELDKATAISLLKKESIQMPEHQKGLVRFTYQNWGLAWGKILANRVNNYLPSALRILK